MAILWATVQLAVFASLGLVVGLLARHGRVRAFMRHVRLAFAKRARFVVVLLIAVLIIVAGLAIWKRLEAPAHPGKPWFERKAALTFSSRDKGWILEDDIVLYPELCGIPARTVPPPGWQRTPQLTRQGWTRHAQGVLTPITPRRAFTYVERVVLPPVSFPSSLAPCLPNRDEVHVAAWTTIRVPANTIIATDPPSTASLLAGDAYLLEFSQPVSQFKAEMVHPWLRNELGHTLLRWNIWTLLQWLLLAVVALFADRVKSAVLQPVIDLLTGRRKPPRRPAGFGL